MIRIRLFLLLTLFNFVLFYSFSSAQENKEESVFIGSINLVYENFKTVDRAFVLSHIPIEEGGEFNRVLSDQSLRALYSTNYFEFVDFKVNKLNLVAEISIHLTAKYQLNQIEFKGNEKYSAARLLELGGLDDTLILDEYSIDSAAEKIENLYLEKGYPDTEINYTIIRDQSTGTANVIFEIKESEKISLKSIRFTGLSAFKPRSLYRIIDSKEKDLFSWLSGSGQFEQAIFDEDLSKIRLFYQNAGFLDVSVDPNKVIFNFKENKASEITIHVDEGEQYFLGQVSIEGATFFTNEELISILNIKDGMVFSPEVIDLFTQKIKEFYTARGYLETRVFANKRSNLSNRMIDITINIRESEKYYLESISIDGNTKSKQRVIIRELALKPGDVFDYKRMQASEIRLKNTNYFDSVRLSPEPSNIPSRKNLNIFVKESRTGSFSFGAGFGSVRSSQFFLEMKQSNFDINDWNSGFQGDGQKFRARIAIGSLSSQILLGFEEPWLFEQRVAFGTNLYSTKSEYNSADYNEQRTGLEMFIRRRLFELVEARFSYIYEVVDIYDVFQTVNYETVPDGIADVFQEAVGEQTVSKFGLTLLRDNRDRLLFTRKGNRTSFSTQFSGLGGDVNYLKYDFRTAQFIPTLDLWEQSLSVIARLGAIVPLKNDSEAPFYDRFFLGGPDSLRGYDYRDIGPRSKDGINFSDESQGGHTYGLLSLEYMFQVADSFGLVLFYDGGFVNESESDYGFDEYADNFGFGARLLMMGSPLKLDYGIPLQHSDHISSSPQFHFSFGTRY